MIAYKYRSGRGTKDSEGKDVFERDMTLLSRDTIYVPTVGQLNDPAEALVDDSIFETQLRFFKKLGAGESLKLVEKSFRDFYKSIRASGIYSLSKRIDNELMWAYYASGHTGYAIIFDTEVLALSFDHGQWGGMYELEMNYSAKLPRFDITKIDGNDTVKALSCFVGTKSKAWEHEDEHRLVFDKGGKELKIDYRAIKGFVFGCRMSEEDIDYVMKTFTGRDLEYYQMELKDDSYKLVLKRLTDKYPTSKKYSPNNVTYDIEELLEADKFIEGVGYKYREFVESALERVSREPFVTGISHIVVSDDQKYPHILVWTKFQQDGSFRPMRSFEYDVVEGKLVSSEG
jgi:hypothetical protein